MSFAIAVPAKPTADATAAIRIHCLGFMRRSPFAETPARKAPS
jgi:hypothetical protein